MSEKVGRGGKLAALDRPLLITTLLLIAIGIALIYSADYALEDALHLKKQALFATVGIILMLILALSPLRYIYGWTFLYYGLILLALLAVKLFGRETLGAVRWLTIFGVNVQPSEPAKLAVILAGARFLGQLRPDELGWRSILLMVGITLPIALLIITQPDLGTSTVFPVIAIAMLAWSGLPIWYFLIVALPFVSLFTAALPYITLPLMLGGFFLLWRSGMRWVGTILMILLCAASAYFAPIVWNNLEPYQQDRLTTFLDPEKDPLGSGYQIIQSKVAIGSGGIQGAGYLKGTQTQLRFLPQQHTDFIFALAGEEFGLIGATTILILFLIYGWRGFRIASRAKTPFASLLAVGITSMITYHAMVNIGMAVGMLPVTGLPLPFISYGGSFLLTCIVNTGFLLSVGLHRRE
ncbi:MAG: rod shape-determining protein RodA [Calditrichaeota bacterium]|nr:rod shape-determining protein RodA [Calditrichota bacterium]